MKATPTRIGVPAAARSTGRRCFAALAAVGYGGPITLELEDAPGASHWTHMREATPEFDDEMRRGMAYLRECASELDMTIS